jgi:hypothetical protein
MVKTGEFSYPRPGKDTQMKMHGGREGNMGMCMVQINPDILLEIGNQIAAYRNGAEYTGNEMHYVHSSKLFFWNLRWKHVAEGTRLTEQRKSLIIMGST